MVVWQINPLLLLGLNTLRSESAENLWYDLERVLQDIIAKNDMQLLLARLCHSCCCFVGRGWYTTITGMGVPEMQLLP